MTDREPEPDLTLIMPCYNEQEVVGYTIPRLVKAFADSDFCLELVAVDNGSRDRTGEILARLAQQHPGVRTLRVEQNQGYGHGLLAGIPAARGRWVGFIPADGQVDAEDVVRLFDALSAGNRPALGKVRRRFRMDGWQRKFVSVGYNVLMRLLWPGLGSIDVNGTPKILPRESLAAMQLQSRDWFFDPEIVIKAYHLGLPVLELSAFGRMRSRGVSHVRTGTVAEFLRNLWSYRFGRRLQGWQQGRKVAAR